MTDLGRKEYLHLRDRVTEFEIAFRVLSLSVDRVDAERARAAVARIENGLKKVTHALSAFENSRASIRVEDLLDKTA